MSIKSQFKAVDIGNVNFSMTLIMSLDDWRRLRDTLSEADHDYPAWQVIDQIRTMVADVSKRWELDDDE